MKFLTRKLVTPADLNPRGTLHGGQLLKWIDEEGGIHAAIELETGLIVTKFISEIDICTYAFEKCIICHSSMYNHAYTSKK